VTTLLWVTVRTRAIRIATTLLAGVTLAATLTACGPNDDQPVHWIGAAGAKASGSPGADQSAANAGDDDGTPGDTTSGSPSGPAGNGTYASRLPKFDKAPTPVRVQLPGGGAVPWVSRVPTDQPVAFLTIDDGWIKRPEAPELFREAGIPVTLFLTINAMKDNPDYFKQLTVSGAVIEAHTITHTKLSGKSYAFQKNEVCTSADKLGQWYGRRPQYFRPPFGEKDATTLKAVKDCGLKAAFFWKETVDKGIVRYQEGKTVQRGDIILMHFRDRFVDDFIAALQAIKNAGLTPALLEDYMPDGSGGQAPPPSNNPGGNNHGPSSPSGNQH
jgi:peptidoglycan/xylan/chitin deacetylase (PgdA/CDA1 family)